MKKFLALLMAVILVFSLTACRSGSEDLSNGSVPQQTNTQTVDFVAPNNYSVVLLASINPQIKLYLDDDGIVLAVEAVNDDAKQIIDSIIYKDTDYQTVIKMFVSVANSNGYIKDNEKIDFEIIEVKNQNIDTNAILSNAATAAATAADELKIILDTKIIDNVDDGEEKNETNSEDGNTPSESQPTQNQSQTTTPSHTHTFSKATCTEPSKCACGTTQGSALGHDWQGATCKAPKTCKTCGATEGQKGDHSYSAGKCTVCGASNTLNPKTDLDTSKEYVGNLKVSGDMLIGGALQFDSEACVVVDRYFNSVQTDPNQTPIVFEGKNYYSEGGGPNPHYFELTDTEIIVKGSFWEGDPDAITIKLVLQGDGTLKVTYSTNSLFPVGCIFSSNINDVLK